VKYMNTDLKAFYLNTPMKRLEYAKLKFDHYIPEATMNKYNLWELLHVGYVYIEIARECTAYLKLDALQMIG